MQIQLLYYEQLAEWIFSLMSFVSFQSAKHRGTHVGTVS